uniref:Bm1060 n=1 Tax=Brugia malayi TaxID=6279 RepID=A0A1I9G6A0_BRUMA|nr:Bm1060 [Brugia malayi]
MEILVVLSRSYSRKVPTDIYRHPQFDPMVHRLSDRLVEDSIGMVERTIIY